MLPLVKHLAPRLLEETGIGTLIAAQILISWSHPGRCRSEAAFARLAGAAPIEATSGQTQTRYRLSRGGDRQLNRALHQAVLIRAKVHQPTKDYIARTIIAPTQVSGKPGTGQPLIDLCIRHHADMTNRTTRSARNAVSHLNS